MRVRSHQWKDRRWGLERQEELHQSNANCRQVRGLSRRNEPRSQAPLVLCVQVNL